MNRTYMTVRKAVNIAVIAVFLAGMIRFVIAITGMPDVIGVHFDGGGNFDVYESKYYGFYPFIIGFVAISLLLCADKVSGKRNSGMALGEKGEKVFKVILYTSSDLIKILMCIFALNWSDSVIKQIPLNITVMMIVFLLMGMVILLMITGAFLTKLIFSRGKKNTDALHRILRLAAWLTALTNIPLILVVWERFPEGSETTDPFALIYFADLGINAPKFLYLLPAVLSIAICIIGDIVIKRRKDLMIAVDITRSTLILFFWIHIVVMPDISTSPVLTVVCIIICIVPWILNRIKKQT
ncbi:MAG: hypothetical protein J6I96_06555 [Oscillospiraceae bacterium]|nr:hypothetical protein [Oscillospiraceae bacterium]